MADKIGIYKITNLTDGKVYIGQSVTVSHRLHEHKRHLRKNIHSNLPLQSAWNKDGEENFVFELIEECSKEKLMEREKYWLDYYGGYRSRRNYNVKEVSEHPYHNEESKIRMSELRKGTNKGENNPMYGRHHTKETRKKISDKVNEWYKTHESAFKNRKHTEETKERLRQLQTGKKASEETRQKLSESSKKMWKNNREELLIKNKENGLKRRIYTEDKRKEIFRVFKECGSRKKTAQITGVKRERCRQIINEMLKEDNA